MMTRWPGWMASLWIWSESVPYSRSYLMVSGFGGELAGLAHGDEAGVQAIGERGAEDEAAGLDAEDEIDVLADVVLRRRRR